MSQYFVFYKPYLTISQFSADGDKRTLADELPGISKQVYPVGRLDHDSEGLLLLTDDRSLTHQLLDPMFAHKRTYYVQVDGAITEQALQHLANGVIINVDGKTYKTKKAEVRLLEDEPALPLREPPIRLRKSVPTSWIAITLTEGKNRQVRKMTAAAGFPTLRLVRYAIGTVTIDGYASGAYKIFGDELKKQLLPRHQ